MKPTSFDTSSTSTKSATSTIPDRRQLSEVALSGVYEVSKILAKPARLETTLSNVLNLLSSFLDMRRGTIMLLDQEHLPDMLIDSCWTEEAGSGSGGGAPREVLDQIVATGLPVIVQNAGRHPLFAVDGKPEDAAAGPVDFIGVPVKIDDRVVGTLSIDRVLRDSNASSFDNDVRFITMIANLIGQTVHLHLVIARDRERLMEESRRLEKVLTQSRPLSSRKLTGIIGDAPPIRALIRKIEIVAKSNATVLLRGESGTGKELFARAIHELSPRAKLPFVKVNCAALPESVLESELFGHEKGAFTGAINARKGRFELADKGTIFLDEIGEISPAFQAKLLRVLQEGEFDRVGATRTQKVDVRVVAATNRDLEDAVVRGTFRADLYYRISVVPLQLPALRDRKGDIPALAQEFLKRFNKENARDLSMTQGAVDVLKGCYFPGNVRELENCIFRTATLSKGPMIEAGDFACGNGECLSATLWKARSSTASGGHLQPQGYRSPAGVTLPERRQQARACEGDTEPHEHTCSCGGTAPGEGNCETPEICAPAGLRVSRSQLIEAMERTGWVQAKAARVLGLTPRQIGYALKKHNVGIKKF